MESSQRLRIQSQTAINSLKANEQQSTIVRGVIEGTWDPAWLHTLSLSTTLTRKVAEVVPITSGGTK